MKSTYAAPVVTHRGDIVRTTLSGKVNRTPTEQDISHGPFGGRNLSFGL